MLEIWKDISNYENIYEVSNQGNVRTKKGKQTYSTLHGVRTWKQRSLKQKTDKKGYKRVNLYKDKEYTTNLVHRLVAYEFIKKVKDKNCVNHIDCNPSNNKKENLEWCNHKENLLHAYENGLNKTPQKTILINKKTKKKFTFRSKAEASRFLGKYQGYISYMILSKRELEEYDIHQEYDVF